MSEQNRQEEAARNDRQRLEQQAVESRQLSERALAEERQRQEIRRMQDEQRRQDSQRQEEQRRQDEQRRQEERRRRDKIESSLEAIRERAKTAEPQSGFVARRESIMRQEQPKQDAPKIDTAYAEEMARKLSALRSEFVKAMVQSAERTSYQPNPIYERQANEIESISKTISEQSRTIKSLQEERDKLGIFKGREKKELQNKIDNFERLRRSNLDKLGALGVSEPSKADEAVKEKRSVAAQEQNRAKAAMQNRGAKERAEEVKAAFLEAAKQIPADQRQEILDRMGQQKEIPTMGRLQYYQAEAEARRQLDTALKQEAQTRERNRTHDRDRGI